MTRTTVKIGNRDVGEGAPCFITYEAGPTHSGIASAKELVRHAAQSGADAVKFQLLDPDRLVADRKLPFSYDVLADAATGRTETVTEPLYDILCRRTLSETEWRELKAYSDSLGLAFFCTALFDDEIDFLVAIGCQSIKIASADLNHYPLLRKVARTGLNIQLDTGNGSLGEMETAVDIIRREGNENIIIHHCPSGYPARLQSINLRVITTLRQMFPYPIAYSDHTPGWDMDIAAVTLGASLVEKTITLDRTHPFGRAHHVARAGADDRVHQGDPRSRNCARHPAARDACGRNQEAPGQSAVDVSEVGGEGRHAPVRGCDRFPPAGLRSRPGDVRRARRPDTDGGPAGRPPFDPVGSSLSRMPAVLFRCDGGPDIGIGHVMRCRALAQAFHKQGWTSVFAMAEASAKLFGEDDPVVVPDGSAGAAAVKAVMVEGKASCLVVDHYGLDADFERQAAPTLTIAIDDLANRPHDCDMLIDANPARTATDYAAHAPVRTQLLLGARYALLRGEFAELRRAPDDFPSVPKHLVAAPGGADPGNISARLLEAVPQLNAAGIRTTLIVGRANPRQADLIAHGRAVGADVVCNPPNPVALMANADIAISGAGTTCLEFACLGIPTVALILADNQRDIANALGGAGAARILDGGGALKAQDIAEAVLTIAADGKARQRMSAAGRTLIDGGGAARVVDEAMRLLGLRKLEQCV